MDLVDVFEIGRQQGDKLTPEPDHCAEVRAPVRCDPRGAAGAQGLNGSAVKGYR